MIRFFTMASDARYNDFSRFCRFFFAFNPESDLYVIPFDEAMSRISRLSSNCNRIKIIDVNPEIDDIGRKIYGSECYRSTVPSWRYFRKFNAFCGHNHSFVFLDANSIVLSTWGASWYFPKMGQRSVYFRGPSKLSRTILNGHIAQSMSELGLNSQTGYNMGGFISHGGVFDPILARALARPELRRVFGRAPEQAFMAFYLSVFGIENGLMTALEPNIRLRHQGEDLITQAGSTFCRINNNKIFALTKYTGSEYTPHASIIEEILKERLAQICGLGSHA